MYGIKHFVADLFSLSGAYSRNSLLKIWPTNSFMVLTYHRVGTNSAGLSSLDAETFSDQISYLKNNYSILKLSEVLKAVQGKSALPPLTLAITFDDGHADTYSTAFPILQKHDISASVFLATALMDGGLIWTDRAQILWARFRGENLETPPRLAEVSKWFKSRTSAIVSTTDFKEHLKTLPPDSIEEILNLLSDDLRSRGLLDENLFKELGLMSWKQAGELASAGWDIGSHSHTHPILARLDEDDVRREVKTSRDLILEKLKINPTIFCYPNGATGDFNQSTKNILREEGFLAALSTIEGINSIKDDLFEIKRMWTTEPHLGLFSHRLKNLLKQD